MTSSDTLCPNCGHNLRADETVERDGFTVDLRAGRVTFAGQSIRLPTSEMIVLHSIAAAHSVVSSIALIERIGYEGDDGTNLIHVYASRLRGKFRDAGFPAVIETVWGRGLRWALDPFVPLDPKRNLNSSANSPLAGDSEAGAIALASASRPDRGDV